jgi:hypothetical protein
VRNLIATDFPPRAYAALCVKNGFLQPSLNDVVVKRGARLAQKESQSIPILKQIRDRDFEVMDGKQFARF